MPYGKPCPKCGLTREYFDNQEGYERHGETTYLILIPMAAYCFGYYILSYASFSGKY